MSERGQSMVEFAFTVGLLMLLVVGTAQVAIFLNYRSSLDLATSEGAFQASLVGHQPGDGKLEAETLWSRLEPGAGPADVSASIEGDLVVVTATAYAPAILPLPFPPFNRLSIQSRSVHTIERFQPGSS